MSLRRRQRLVLARTETALGQADARLAGMFAVFNFLAAGESIPATEQVSRRAEIRRWAGRRSSALAIAAIVALLAVPAVIAAGGGPVCGRGMAPARYPAMPTRGCLMPGACPALLLCRQRPRPGDPHHHVPGACPYWVIPHLVPSCRLVLIPVTMQLASLARGSSR